MIWWDTRQQLLQYNGLPNALSEGAVTDHHPILDTYLYGWFTDIGRALGSIDAGVYIFCLVQAFLTAWALACCLILVRRLGGRRDVCVALLAFLCLYWHLPIYASAMAKDATFLPFFLLFSVASIEVMRSRGATPEGTRFPCCICCPCVACGADAQDWFDPHAGRLDCRVLEGYESEWASYRCGNGGRRFSVYGGPYAHGRASRFGVPAWWQAGGLRSHVSAVRVADA